MTIERARIILGEKCRGWDDDRLVRHLRSLEQIAEIAADDILKRLSKETTFNSSNSKTATSNRVRCSKNELTTVLTA